MLKFRRARNLERTPRHVRENTKKDRRVKSIVSPFRFLGITLRLVVVHLHCFKQTTLLNTPKTFPSRLTRSVPRLAWWLRPHLSAHKSRIVIGHILGYIITKPLLLVHEDTRENIPYRAPTKRSQQFKLENCLRFFILVTTLSTAWIVKQTQIIAIWLKTRIFLQDDLQEPWNNFVNLSLALQ